MLKCLWISRDLPFPLDAGDKIYSAQLARSLADAGAHVRFMASAGPGDEPPLDWPIGWEPVRHLKRPAITTILSPLPSVAAMHAAAEYRHALRRNLSEEWDCIVIDSYGSGWALNECLAARRGRGRPVLVYLSHNHEEQLWGSMAQTARASWPRRLAIRQNAMKVQVLERRLVRSADLVSAITPEDAHAYSRYAPDVPKVVLTPGYSGDIAPPRVISASTPRHVALVGSFRWAIKQENLRRFVAAADGVFAVNRIHLDVVGDVPLRLRRELDGLQATRFHGFVPRPAAVLQNARIAVVPELIGGGFKLKLLDYIFGRVPVATLTAAAAGLPERTRAALLCRDDMASLVRGICEAIDDLPRLNAMQIAALAGATHQFNWQDRGRALAAAIHRSLASDSEKFEELAEVLHG